MEAHEMGAVGEKAPSWDVVADAAQAMMGAAARMSEALREGAAALSRQSEDLIEAQKERDELRAELVKAEASWVHWRCHSIGLLDMLCRVAGAHKDADPDHPLLTDPRGFSDNKEPLGELARGYIAALEEASDDLEAQHPRAAEAYMACTSSGCHLIDPVVSAGRKYLYPVSPELWTDDQRPMDVEPSLPHEATPRCRSLAESDAAPTTEIIFERVTAELSTVYQGAQLKEALKALKELSPRHKLLRNRGRFSDDGRPLNELQAQGFLAMLRRGRALRTEVPALDVRLEVSGDGKKPVVIVSLFGATESLNLPDLPNAVREISADNDTLISREHEALAKENEQLKADLRQKEIEVVGLAQREVKLSYYLQRAERHWAKAVKVIEYDVYVTFGRLAEMAALSKALRKVAPEHELFRKTDHFYRNGQQKKVIRTIYDAGFESAVRERQGGQLHYHPSWWIDRARKELLNTTPPDWE